VTDLIFGIDAASFQAHVNWAQVDGVCAFGFEKVSEGTGYVNPYWAAAKPAMLARRDATWFLPGAYLFLDASNGAAQADRFAAAGGNLDGWAIAIDVERSAGSPSMGQAKDCVARLRQHYPHHKIGGYLPHWFWGGQDATFVDWLWASSYVNGSGEPGALYSRVPGAYWDGYGGRDPALLQFTSSATVPGVGGLVDCSAFRGDQAALRAALGVPAPSTPKPAPKPPPPAHLAGYTVWKDSGGVLRSRTVTSADGGHTWK
jgi:lysozyme